MFLGVILGLERNIAGKMAGMRTYALVSVGSALFVIISRLVAVDYIGISNFDPLRMASQVIVGIGFIGAGLVFFKGNHPVGITTATGIWVVSGIGIACGFGLYALATFVTGLTVFVFTIMWIIERDLMQVWSKKKGAEKSTEKIAEEYEEI